MTTTTLPSPALKPNTLYFAGQDIVCATIRCAGATLLYSGRTIGGARASKVTKADLAEWATYGFTAMTCQCGAISTPVTVTP